VAYILSDDMKIICFCFCFCLYPLQTPVKDITQILNDFQDQTTSTVGPL